MKQCGVCKEFKELELFSKNARTADGRHRWCKVCFAKYERERYQKGDKARKVANRHKVRESNREFVWNHLKNNPCVDCGEFDPIVLEFDHQKDKSIEVSLMYHGSQKKLSEEIAKCEVRCCNCHRRRTVKQLGWWKDERV